MYQEERYHTSLSRLYGLKLYQKGYSLEKNEPTGEAEADKTIDDINKRGQNTSYCQVLDYMLEKRVVSYRRETVLWASPINYVERNH